MMIDEYDLHMRGLSEQQVTALQAIFRERDNQAYYWGGKDHDRQHDLLDFIGFILEKAEKRINDDAEETDDEVSKAKNRVALVKIAALALAALEAEER